MNRSETGMVIYIVSLVYRFILFLRLFRLKIWKGSIINLVLEPSM